MRLFSIVLFLGLSACASVHDAGRKANGEPLTIADGNTIQSDSFFSTKEKNRYAPSQVDYRVYAIAEKKGQQLNDNEAKSLAYALLDASDVACEDYMIGLSYRKNKVSTSMGIMALTFSTLASIVTPENNAANLAAASTITANARQTLNDEVFSGQTFSLIYDAVRKGRKTLRSGLEAKIEKNTFSGRTPESILATMQPYHFSCGINYGLQFLSEILDKEPS